MKTRNMEVKAGAGAGSRELKAGLPGEGKTPKFRLMGETEKKVSIVLVEDEATVARASKSLLEKAAARLGMKLDVVHTTHVDGIRAWIEDGISFDLILLDLKYGNKNQCQGKPLAGVDFIEWLIKQGRDKVLDSIVVFSGSPGDLSKEAMAAINYRTLSKSDMEIRVFNGLLGHVSEGRLGEWRPPVDEWKPAGKTLSVLLVEDDLSVIKMVTNLLPRSAEKENIGVFIEHAGSADEVPGLLERGERFDLILLDLVDGTCGGGGGPQVNGVGLIKELMKAGRQDVLDTIVAFSGTAGELTRYPDAMKAIGNRLLDKSHTKAFGKILELVHKGELTTWNPPRPSWEFPGSP